MPSSIPTFNQLMNPCLEELQLIGGTCTPKDIQNRIIKRYSLYDISNNEMVELRKRIAWVKTYFTVYGLMEDRGKGIWALSSKGITTEEVIPRDVRRYYEIEKKLIEDSKRRVQPSENPVQRTPDDIGRSRDTIKTEIRERKAIFSSLSGIANPLTADALDSIGLPTEFQVNKKNLIDGENWLNLILTINIEGKDIHDNLTDNLLLFHPETHDTESFTDSRLSQIPLFIIIKDSEVPDKILSVKMGIVRKVDPSAGNILIELYEDFHDDWNDSNITFHPYEEDEHTDFRTSRIKRRDPEFKMEVERRYGHSCAVCELSIQEAIDAAHIVEKKDNGTDDIRNGIPLCVNHHRFFDRHLFAFNDEYQVIVKGGFDLNVLRITKADIMHLGKLPHPAAIRIRFEQFQSKNM